MSKLRDTYIFWAIFSFYNFGFLFPLAIPPLIIFFALFYIKFIAFVLPVMFGSIILTSGVVYLIKTRRSKTNSTASTAALSTYLINGIFLLSFLALAEGFKTYLIHQALENHKPECVQTNSFFSSLGHGGHDNQFEEHALFVEGGKTFFWSYSKLDFFEGSEALSRNFPCSTSK